MGERDTSAEREAEIREEFAESPGSFGNPAVIADLLAMLNAVCAERKRRCAEGPHPLFMDIVARTGRMYAHPTTAAALRAEMVTADPTTIAPPIGIEIVESSMVEVGLLVAIDHERVATQRFVQRRVLADAHGSLGNPAVIADLVEKSIDAKG